MPLKANYKKTHFIEESIVSITVQRGQPSLFSLQDMFNKSFETYATEFCIVTIKGHVKYNNSSNAIIQVALLW